MKKSDAAAAFIIASSLITTFYTFVLLKNKYGIDFSNWFGGIIVYSVASSLAGLLCFLFVGGIFVLISSLTKKEVLRFNTKVTDFYHKNGGTIYVNAGKAVVPIGTRVDFCVEFLNEENKKEIVEVERSNNIGDEIIVIKTIDWF